MSFIYSGSSHSHSYMPLGPWQRVTARGLRGSISAKLKWNAINKSLLFTRINLNLYRNSSPFLLWSLRRFEDVDSKLNSKECRGGRRALLLFLLNLLISGDGGGGVEAKARVVSASHQRIINVEESVEYLQRSWGRIPPPLQFHSKIPTNGFQFPLKNTQAN